MSGDHLLDGVNTTDDGSAAHCSCGLSFFVPAMIVGDGPPRTQHNTYGKASDRHEDHRLTAITPD